MEQNKQENMTQKAKNLVNSVRKNAVVIGLGIVAGVIALAKIISMITSFMAKGSTKVVKDAKKESGLLRSEQDAANTAANVLVEDANKMSENKPEVDEDWHKR